MNLKIFPLITLFAACAFYSCEEENNIKPLSNIDLPQSLIGTRDAMPYAGRKEIPEIKDPTMFIVHRTDKYGVTYSIEWDKEQRTQRWAAYTLDISNNNKSWKRDYWSNGTTWKGRYWTGDPFQEDSIIPKECRTKLTDYSSQRGSWNNRYDRGHIVNSNDRLMSKNANGQTYYLSNIQPQLKGFNGSAADGGIWLNFENKVNSWGQSLKAEETLYIVKGGTTQKTERINNPFIDDKNIDIKVPAYFFMAILKRNTKGEYQAIGFWAKHENNSDKNLKKYCKSIDELEELTGINFFHNLDDVTENEVEKQCNPSNWRIYQ